MLSQAVGKLMSKENFDNETKNVRSILNVRFAVADIMHIHVAAALGNFIALLIMAFA